MVFRLPLTILVTNFANVLTTKPHGFLALHESIFMEEMINTNSSAQAVFDLPGQPKHFLGLPVASSTNLNSSVENLLDFVLKSAMYHHSNIAVARYEAIEARLWSTFQALPKNKFGRLAPREVHYTMYNFFMQDHGWVLNGFGPHNAPTNLANLKEASMLQDKVPELVETLLETRRSQRGLSLSDVAAVIVTIELLIFGESQGLLQEAYTLNGLPLNGPVDESELLAILQSYRVLYEQGPANTMNDPWEHDDVKQQMLETETEFFSLEAEALVNHNIKYQNRLNPFSQRSYGLADASEMVFGILQRYGRWQNDECLAMKDHLMQLDPNFTGRVPLSTFYTQPENTSYRFDESQEYLAQIGVLDNSSFAQPQVLIANYVLGPSNCLKRSSHYSVCCLNECETLMNDIEAEVQGPAAPPDQLIQIVQNMSSSSANAPRQLDPEMVSKLHSAADPATGGVLLHGRFFAHFLHAAFPYECPYPHTDINSSSMDPYHWGTEGTKVTEGGRQLVIDHAKAVENSTGWSEEEELVSRTIQTSSHGAHYFLRAAMQLASVCVLCRLVAAFWQTIRHPNAAGVVDKGDTYVGQSLASSF